MYLMLRTSDSPEKVEAFYQGELRRQEWRMNPPLHVSGGTVITRTLVRGPNRW